MKHILEVSSVTNQKMKSILVPAVFLLVAFATFSASVSAQTTEEVAPGANITAVIANALEQALKFACEAGLLPCGNLQNAGSANSRNFLFDFLYGIGILPDPTYGNGTRSALYNDGTPGHPLPVELITAARSFDDTVNRLLCIVPVTCPKNYESESRIDVPSVADVLQNVVLPPAADPIVQQVLCGLGLKKCD